MRRRGRTSATATDGSAATVVAIERTHGQVVFGFVRRLGVDDAAAADVVQEALLRLYHRLVAGDAIVDAKAWVFHVAYRLAMDEHRRFGRERRLTAVDFGCARPGFGRPGFGRRRPTGVGGRRPPARAATSGALPALPSRPRFRSSRCHPRHHGECGAQPLHAGAGDAAGASGAGGGVMDDLDVEALLREADPAEPPYLGDVAARACLPAVRPDRNVGQVVPAGRRGSPRAQPWSWCRAGVVVLVAGHDERPVEHEPPATPQPVTEPGVLVDRWVGAPRVAAATGPAFVDISDDMLVQRSGDPNAGTAWASSWTVADGVLTLDLLGIERGCEPGSVGTYRGAAAHRAARR